MKEHKPEITLLACRYCGSVPLELAGIGRVSCPATVKVEYVPCAGRVDVLHLLIALEQGADAVFVLTCPEGHCHHRTGNQRAWKRVERARQLIEAVGLEPERVGYLAMGIGEGEQWAEEMYRLTDRIAALGPTPLRREGANDDHR